MDKKSLTAIYRSAGKVAANKHSVALVQRNSQTGKFVSQKESKGTTSPSGGASKRRG